jgi:DNA-binding transcriptional ArsR family regulator
MKEEDVEKAAAVFNALGNQTRLRILTLVSETPRPLHIMAVAKGLDLDYAALYRHVRILKDQGLLEVYEVGRSRVLTIKDAKKLGQIIEKANTMSQSR